MSGWVRRKETWLSSCRFVAHVSGGGGDECDVDDKEWGLVDCFDLFTFRENSPNRK